MRGSVLLPVATGMALLLLLLTLRQQRPNARHVIWPRIDQKSCFKCIFSAGKENVIMCDCDGVLYMRCVIYEVCGV